MAEVHSGEGAGVDPVASDGLGALEALTGAGSAVDVEGLRALLSRSYLLFQPNLAGMGVGAWDLAVATPELAQPEAAARRMLQGSDALSAFLAAHGAPSTAAVDPAAPGRIADLEQAIRQIVAGQEILPGEADTAHDDLEVLRRQLQRRLAEERLHHPLSTAPQPEPEPESDLPAAIGRAEAPERSPYTEALETPVAQAMGEAPEGLEALRERIVETTESALAAAGSATARRLVERARRLLAAEVELTGGKPGAFKVGVDTTTARRALMGVEGATERPQAPAGVGPAPGLTEIPIRSSRGPKAKIVGYLAAGEVAAELATDDPRFTRISAPGRSRPGWIEARWLQEIKAARSSRGRLPGVEMTQRTPSSTTTSRPGGLAGGLELARFAKLVAANSDQPLATLLAQLKDPAELERTLAKAPQGAAEGVEGVEGSKDTKTAKLPNRGAAAATPRAPGAPIRIGRVDVAGLSGPNAARAAAVLNAALQLLPGVLDRRLRQDEGALSRLSGRGTVNAAVLARADGNLATRAAEVADQLAGALVAAGRAEVTELRINARSEGPTEATPQVLLASLANDDSERITGALRSERKVLDATAQARLASYFGRGFDEVMIFAGPMAGALARSLNAEAITHGKMVFFDPLHYRPDTAKGEALMAHELAHTLQTDDRDSRYKEAEALAAEAGYLDWIQPGGAPLAQDSLLDPTAPGAAAAGDIAGGVHRAEKGRKLQASQGPRDEVATSERQVAQVLEKVRELMGEASDIDGQLVGRLSRIFSGPI